MWYNDTGQVKLIMVYIIMGVSGSGKTTIGRMLAHKLAMKFYDADDYHPKNNLNKMKNLVALDDEDRIPWLLDMAAHIAQWDRDNGAVLACSALKEKYRRILSRDGNQQVTFIYLECDKNTILERMKMRRGHFFPSELLESQFDALEVPLAGILVKNDGTPDLVCMEIIDKITGNRPAAGLCRGNEI